MATLGSPPPIFQESQLSHPSSPGVLGYLGEDPNKGRHVCQLCDWPGRKGQSGETGGCLCAQAQTGACPGVFVLKGEAFVCGDGV